MIKATENRVKSQVSMTGPDEWLYLKGATWVTCKTHTAILHKNECGPRALLCGMIIALHPGPNKKTLEHFMHQDLQRYLRISL